MNLITPPHTKIISQDAIPGLKYDWQKKNHKVVFTNGCFDIMHRGHVEYLYKASLLGDIFFIGLNSDESVRRLKGKYRPVLDQESRSLIMASFQYVDYICIFEEDTPYDLINIVQPDVLVKGGDYTPEEIVGYDIVKKKGGEVITLDFIEGFSSTSLINKLRKA